MQSHHIWQFVVNFLVFFKILYLFLNRVRRYNKPSSYFRTEQYNYSNLLHHRQQFRNKIAYFVRRTVAYITFVIDSYYNVIDLRVSLFLVKIQNFFAMDLELQFLPLIRTLTKSCKHFSLQKFLIFVFMSISGNKFVKSDVRSFGIDGSILELINSPMNITKL